MDEDWDVEELGEGEGEKEMKVSFDEWCSRVQALEPSADEKCPTLLELCCRVAGRALPFQLVQEAPFDRDVQRRVAYWSFPSCYSDIRRYIELSSGSLQAARDMYQSAASLSLASHVQIGGSRAFMSYSK